VKGSAAAEAEAGAAAAGAPRIGASAGSAAAIFVVERRGALETGPPVLLLLGALPCR
jgi:hypothetical protein